MYRLPEWGRAHIEQAFDGAVRVVAFDESNPPGGLEETIDVYWGNYFSAARLERMPRLKWIHCASVGVNRAIVPEVALRQIAVTNSRGLLAAPVAAMVMGMIGALARGLHRGWQLRAEGALNRLQFDQYFDELHDLEGETCLIVGLGEAGTRVAAACAALGMTVEGIRNRSTAPPAGVARVHTLANLTEAVRTADFVVNLLPLTPATKGVFDQGVFQAMKPTASFINVGRGPTVDEAALIGALEAGTIASAGLDVFEVEPLPADSRLWTLPRTILMPHVACLSTRYWPRQIALLEDNIRLFAAGKPLANTVDFTLGY